MKNKTINAAAENVSVEEAPIKSDTNKPAWSFKGWNIGALLKGNKEAAKIIVSFLFGLLVPTDPTLKVLLGGLCKALLDTIDFYSSQVNLNK
jgi:hypothetical protein